MNQKDILKALNLISELEELTPKKTEFKRVIGSIKALFKKEL